jgi:alginate O-acetyltransferase complex protein AlgI
MRGLALLLLAALIAAAAFSFGGLDRNVAVHASLEAPGTSRPVALPLAAPVILDAANGDSLSISIEGYGPDHVGVLSITADGASLEVIVGDGGRRSQRTSCTTECRVVARVVGDTTTVVRVVSKGGEATLRTLAFEPVTSRHHGGTSGLAVMSGFGLMLLFGPLLVWLRRWPGAEQAALALAGMVWIGVASLAGLVVAIAFVLVGYLVIKGLSRVKDRRSRALAAALAGVALIVALLKFAAPVMASAFANPGGLWLALPLGISYLAIRLIDLILAAHARALRGLTLLDYTAFMLSPHTLPAGPIQLYGDFLRGRIEGWSSVDLAAGAARMGVGVAKKLLADSFLLPLVTVHMGNHLTGTGDPQKSVLIMLVANLLYVYLDFSAYCDLAIGAARAGGRRLPENFNWPLVRGGLRRYWRHWHMTLSQWVMRRVYFPAFLASHSTTLALIASMLTIGLWHAPTISWTLWALHHSLAMAAEGRINPDPPSGEAQPGSLAMRVAAAGRHFVGMIFMLGWVSLGHAFTLFAAPRVAIETYLAALSAPFIILWRLCS